MLFEVKRNSSLSLARPERFIKTPIDITSYRLRSLKRRWHEVRAIYLYYLSLGDLLKLYKGEIIQKTLYHCSVCVEYYVTVQRS